MTTRSGQGSRRQRGRGTKGGEAQEAASQCRHQGAEDDEHEAADSGLLVDVQTHTEQRSTCSLGRTCVLGCDENDAGGQQGIDRDGECVS